MGFLFSVWNGGGGWLGNRFSSGVFWVMNNVGACNRVASGGFQRM